MILTAWYSPTLVQPMLCWLWASGPLQGILPKHYGRVRAKPFRITQRLKTLPSAFNLFSFLFKNHFLGTIVLHKKLFSWIKLRMAFFFRHVNRNHQFAWGLRSAMVRLSSCAYVDAWRSPQRLSNSRLGSYGFWKLHRPILRWHQQQNYIWFWNIMFNSKFLSYGRHSS